MESVLVFYLTSEQSLFKKKTLYSGLTKLNIIGGKTTGISLTQL